MRNKLASFSDIQSYCQTVDGIKNMWWSDDARVTVLLMHATAPDELVYLKGIQKEGGNYLFS
jgi:hypothetical protein